MTTETNAVNVELNTLEAEGLALAKEWKAICKADAKRFNAFTKADGFDTRLGKLMQALKLECEGRISTKRLMDCGINSIDKRRRSEALWFVENEVECRAFIAESKKGFTSLTALQAAMRKAAKQPVEADAATDDTATEGSADVADAATEGNTKSNVGPSDLAAQFMQIAESNGVNILDVIDAMLLAATGESVDALAAKAA